MPRIFNKETGTLLGTVDANDVQCLIDVLEEEDTKDVDYYIDPATVDILEDNGASASLVEMLRKAIGAREGIDIRWEK
jgi:processive 1,2-diacylglycerol beta-glucosyltransferase